MDRRKEVIDMTFAMSQTFAEDNNIDLDVVLKFTKELTKVVADYALERGTEIVKEVAKEREREILLRQIRRNKI